MFMTQFSRYSPVQGAQSVAQKRRMPQPLAGFAVATPLAHAGDSVHFGSTRTTDGSTVSYRDATLSEPTIQDPKIFQDPRPNRPQKSAAIKVTIHGKEEKYVIYSQNLADIMENDENDVHEIYQEKNPHVNGLICKSKNGGDWHTLEIRDPQDPLVTRTTEDAGSASDPAPKTLTLTLVKQ